jgi:hypothetical protein
MVPASSKATVRSQVFIAGPLLRGAKVGLNKGFPNVLHLGCDVAASSSKSVRTVRKYEIHSAETLVWGSFRTMSVRSGGDPPVKFSPDFRLKLKNFRRASLASGCSRIHDQASPPFSDAGPQK